MKKLGLARGFDLQSPIVVRFMLVWSIVSVLLMLFLLWYVFDKTRLSSAVVAKVVTPTPSTGYQIELGGENPSVNEVVAKVAQHMFLPRGEVKVATIIDAEGLRADFPEVYTYAQNGQKALFYPNGLIIFDPVSDRIVDVIRK